MLSEIDLRLPMHPENGLLSLSFRETVNFEQLKKWET